MKKLIVIMLLFTGCTSTQQFLSSPQGQALLTNGESLASVAVNAAATTYGGPAAGQLASEGLNALGTVLQGYVNKQVPSTIVKASPGITSIGNAVAPLISSIKPVSQTDVNTVFSAASIAAKK